MTDVQLEIQLVAAVVAAACALPGVFLVLRQMAMMSDAVSHAILPGIVVAFFLVQDLSSPLLILGAALTGVLTVALVELLHRTRLVKEDAAIGLVFPALFSIGVILIARYAGDIHLDTDAVLLGELAFVPFDRLVLGPFDLGPRALYLMGGVGLLNGLFILVFYKELKLATFDSGLAAALGFAPALLHYALMGLVSVTAVAAFDAVGSILVVALMVGPPAAAHLLTDRLARMIGWSVLIGVGSAVGGYWLAHAFDASIAGSMATMVGVCFGGAFLFAPQRGVVAVLRRQARQRWTFAQKMLTIHLLHHEGLPEAEHENHIDHLHEHLRWKADVVDRVVRQAMQNKLVARSEGQVVLTEAGRRLAREAIVQA
ncbi:MAG: metal ABC transporter permease [Rhodothermales bacterium]